MSSGGEGGERTRAREAIEGATWGDRAERLTGRRGIERSGSLAGGAGLRPGARDVPLLRLRDRVVPGEAFLRLH